MQDCRVQNHRSSWQVRRAKRRNSSDLRLGELESRCHFRDSDLSGRRRFCHPQLKQGLGRRPLHSGCTPAVIAVRAQVVELITPARAVTAARALWSSPSHKLIGDCSTRACGGVAYVTPASAV